MASLILRKCVECRKEFDSVNERKTCSDECRAARKARSAAKYRARRVPGKKSANIIGSIQRCELCGKKYEKRGSIQKYCSEACARKAKADRENAAKARTVLCSECGAEFRTSVKSISTLCSEACRAAKKHRSMLAHHHGDDVRPPSMDFVCPCPWATGKANTLPQGITTWDCPEMDPFGAGHYQVRLDMGEAAERRKAA